MEIRKHKESIVNRDLILCYGLFGKPVINISSVGDSLVINTVSRSGDVSLFRYNPKRGHFRCNFWDIAVTSAYDTTHFQFGELDGDMFLNKENSPFDDILLDVMQYDQPAITPKDKDGFIRLRPRPNIVFSYTGPMNYREIKGDKGYIYSKKSANSCKPDTVINVYNVDDDNKDVNHLVQMLVMMGDRVEVKYRNTYSVFGYDLLDEEFHFDYGGNVSLPLMRCGGSMVETMIGKVYDRKKEDTKFLDDVFSWIIQFFARKETYQEDQFYHYGVYHGIMM